MKPIEYEFCPKCGGRLVKKELEHRERLICSRCSFIFYQNPVPSVGMIVIRDGNCLCIKRGKAPGQGTWAPPSGFLECDETLQEAAERELFEETGLRGKVRELLGAYSEINDVYGDVVTVVYLMEAQGKPKAGDDALDAKFFPLDNMPKIHFRCFIEALKIYKERYVV